MPLPSVLSFLENLPIYQLKKKTYNGRDSSGDLLPCRLNINDIDKTLVNTKEIYV